MSRISYPSFVVAVISIISPVLFQYMFRGFGGQISIVFAFFAIIMSLGDPSAKNIFNVILWLILGIASYVVAMWNAFNVFVGSFLGIVSCFFFFGNAILIAFTKTDRIEVKIASVVVVLLIIIHLIFIYFSIQQNTELLIGWKNSIPGFR